MGVQVQIDGQWVDVADTTPSGLISAFGGAVAPTGYLVCDGSAVSRTTYANLFAAIGTVWGSGDGSTTFNLPDLRGMFLRGTGTNGGATKKANGNAYAGAELGSVQEDEFQGHKHVIDVEGAQGGTGKWLYNDSSNGGTVFGYDETELPKTDGTNGTPRTGDETCPVSAGVNYIIKT